LVGGGGLVCVGGGGGGGGGGGVWVCARVGVRVGACMFECVCDYVHVCECC